MPTIPDFTPPPNQSHRPFFLWRVHRFAILLVTIFSLLPFPVGAQPPAQDDTSPVHLVRYGETLSEIAQAYGISLDMLMADNAITDADDIRVGQRLLLPAPVADTLATQPSVSPALVQSLATPTAAGRVASLNQAMVVRAGDNLGWIALRYGVDLAALRALNGLDMGENAIALGQTLLLPATAADLRVAAPNKIHTVQRGESLGLIAQANGVTVRELLAANRISSPDTIQPGQELVIPGPVREAKAPPVGPARSGFFYHNVQPGDTMSQLSKDFDTTPQAIVRYNSLPDEQTIFSGLDVRIPYGPPVLNRRLPPTPQSVTEFIISITRQRCWVMQDGAILHAWPCSTGQGEWATRTGTFPIKTKLELAKSSAYRLDMPFWLGLYDVGSFENGIHGLPVDWNTGEQLWDTLVGQPATFGCAMLLDKDAATLFNLAYLGMPVHIVD